MADESKRVSDLVGDLLALSRLEREDAKPEYAVFDINEMLRRAIIRRMDDLEKKRIEGADFHRRSCVHYLEGESHAFQYGEWRDALMNRTQVFKDNKFLFNRQVIQGFRPSGFILFVKTYAPTMNERLTSLRTLVGKNKKDFASRLGIPYRTYQDWELGNNKMPEYILDLIGFRVKNDPTLSD